MIQVTPIQTGSVSIRPHHHCDEEGHGPVRRHDVTYVLAGDATYDERFLLKELVDGVTYDVELSKQTLRRIKQ